MVASIQIEDIETINISIASTPLDSFLYALRAKETLRQYPKRLKIFFNCGLDSKLSLTEQANLFYKFIS